MPIFILRFIIPHPICTVTMPNPLYSPQPAGAITTTGNTCDAHMFSRQSSTRHPTVRENGIGDGGERQQSQRGRKASASAAAVPLADRRRRSTNPPEKRHVSKLMDGHSSTETPAAAQHQQIASELCCQLMRAGKRNAIWQ